jgi:3-hydroxyacyl-CoA dehydrogenase
MTVVNLEIQDGVGLITIDNPPINATSHAVRKELVETLSRAEADDAISALVLICAGKTFIAGADVSEFGKPPLDPILPDVILRLEATTKPLIAALHGTVLGGGLEVALGCHYRIAAPGTKLGFPEVNLGLIPGAGGTVRTPRLIAADRACGLISGGKPVLAASAKAWGLIDDLAPGDLRTAAIAFAKEAAKRPLPMPASRRDPMPMAETARWEDILNNLARKSRGQNAPVIAATMVRDATEMPADEALAAERTLFVSLRDSEQSRALRHIFFAERSVGKLPALRNVSPRPIDEIGVIGGGIMGAGIASSSLLAGYRVTMIERDTGALQKGIETIQTHLAGALKRGLIGQSRHDTLINSVIGSTDYGALGDANLVIEAVFEDMNVKSDVFQKLDGATRPDAVLASNTSYLDINRIADVVADPGRVIGLHFFSPAHIMKLLEVVRTDRASPEVLATAMAFGRKLGKIAVPTGVCDGFIGNRIMSAYRKHCEYMLEDGATPYEIDAAMIEFGFPIGLFAMQDMAGLEISWATRKRLAATRSPDERYVALGDYLCEMGRFGRKNGAGWYLYTDDAPNGAPDPEVIKLIEAESKKKGITRRPFGADEIIGTILSAMQTEGEKILAEGIADSPEAIDVVMVNGYGFPRWRGGPMFLRHTG